MSNQELAEFANKHELPTLPCKYCGLPTLMLGTRLCDRCWELEHRVKNDIEITIQILNTLGYIVKLKKKINHV